jgi:non-heme Fe2+,alpha-ketoglutarate-dependent halogenase
VRVYPYQDHLDEYGVKVSLEKYGCVLVAGNDEYGHNRIVDRTVNGTPFPAPR